jgi:hypothetical protein
MSLSIGIVRPEIDFAGLRRHHTASAALIRCRNAIDAAGLSHKERSRQAPIGKSSAYRRRLSSGDLTEITTGPNGPSCDSDPHPLLRPSNSPNSSRAAFRYRDARPCESHKDSTAGPCVMAVESGFVAKKPLYAE